MFATGMAPPGMTGAPGMPGDGAASPPADAGDDDGRHGHDAPPAAADAAAGDGHAPAAASASDAAASPHAGYASATSSSAAHVTRWKVSICIECA
ncbi:hypothetical protein THAOC_32408 [Thalassiosira oceanica]|uniref:Uncharacterized protein n=1 Tax=Thalassiosira oceanica TaxID=159749 RepID=K0R7A9_THAOC|nr:hypothetical protein THAOC_32408 [Thalassiosira oceanica]|eukprot:EJK48765.1 hypothetical protein THAOC_32408 [Thalassiosira oceanica]